MTLHLQHYKQEKMTNIESVQERNQTYSIFIHF